MIALAYLFQAFGKSSITFDARLSAQVVASVVLIAAALHARKMRHVNIHALRPAAISAGSMARTRQCLVRRVATDKVAVLLSAKRLS